MQLFLYFVKDELYLLIVFVEKIGRRGTLDLNIANVFSDVGADVLKAQSHIVVGSKAILSSPTYYGFKVVNASEVGSPIALDNLQLGLNYHIKVSAWNGVGSDYGEGCGSYPAIIVPSREPSSVPGGRFVHV